MLLAFTRCSYLEVWFSEGPLHYRWTSDTEGHTSYEASQSETPDFHPLIGDRAGPLSRAIESVLHGRITDLGPNRTDDGTWWTPDASHLLAPQKAPDSTATQHEAITRGSLALIRIDVDPQTRGLLLLASSQRGSFSAETIESYEAIAQTLGMAIASRRAQAELRERVKEFACLYGIAHILEHREMTRAECLRKIVQLLPPAWQFPDIAAARIVLDGQTFDAGEPDRALHHQAAEIVVNGVPRGRVEVGYHHTLEEFDAGPFLREETSLIQVIAREISHFVERSEVSEQRLRLEEQLLHADRLATIGQFAAGIAHEINEPLGGILGFAQLARKDAGVSQQAAADIEQIIAAALRAREIVRKLMLFARQTPPSKALINLNDIVEEAVAFLKPSISGKPVELVKDLDTSCCEIAADPIQMHQVAVNLIVNAIQALPGKGRITVRTQSLQSVAKLTVEDNGEGIAPEHLSKIFNPFFTTKDVGVGTGLGLSVVHGIVTSHGGSIDVYSRQGEGAKFEITLPVNGSSPTEEVAS